MSTAYGAAYQELGAAKVSVSVSAPRLGAGLSRAASVAKNAGSAVKTAVKKTGAGLSRAATAVSPVDVDVDVYRTTQQPPRVGLFARGARAIAGLFSQRPQIGPVYQKPTPQMLTVQAQTLPGRPVFQRVQQWVGSTPGGAVAGHLAAAGAIATVLPVIGWPLATLVAARGVYVARQRTQAQRARDRMGITPKSYRSPGAPPFLPAAKAPYPSPVDAGYPAPETGIDAFAPGASAPVQQELSQDVPTEDTAGSPWGLGIAVLLGLGLLGGGAYFLSRRKKKSESKDKDDSKHARS